MLTLIHGEDTTASRNYYYELKQKSLENITLDGQSLTLADLQQALSGDDLFGTKKDIFIENLLSKRKSPKDVDTLVSLLITHSSIPITLWESRELTKKQLEPFSHATIKLFKIPSTIFALLDALKPDNGKQLIELFHKTLTDKDAEFVLVMLQRQVRILLALSSSSENQHPRGEEKSREYSNTSGVNPEALSTMPYAISEVTRLAPWQKGKLEKQAKLFTPDELIDIHSQLFELELGMKTGGLSLPLAESMDLLLLSI